MTRTIPVDMNNFLLIYDGIGQEQEVKLSERPDTLFRIPVNFENSMKMQCHK